MLKVEHLTKSYQTGSQVYPVLKDISLEVEKGEFVAVMGPSGSGKTTLLNCISCFIPYEDGSILLAGKDLSGLKEEGLAKVRNQSMGFVFQDFMLLDGLSVFENICLPQIIAKRPIPQMEAKARHICRLFGIEKIMEKYPADISGGEKQRTAVARALMNQPYVILADEPTGNLDEDTAQDITEILKESAHKMNKCVVVVTHSNELAKQADVVFRLKKGELQVLERVQDGAAQPQSRRNNAPRSERRAH